MKLNKLLYLDLIDPFFFGLAAFATVFFIGAYLEDMIKWLREGMPFLTAIKAIIFVLPSIMSYILPMSTLLAVLLGMSRLSGDSEIVALYASGVSLRRIALPFAVFGLIVTIFAFILSEYVSSVAYSHFEEIENSITEYIVKKNESFLYYEKNSNSLISIGGIENSEDGILNDVTIVRYKEKTSKTINGEEIIEKIPTTVVHATQAKWHGMSVTNDPIEESKNKFTWVLYNGFMQNLGTDSTETLSFKETKSDTDILSVQIEMNPDIMRAYKMSKDNPEERSFTELGEAIETLKPFEDRYEHEIRELAVNRLNKISLPLACLVFALVAVPLGMRPNRSSSSVGFGISLLIILAYYLLWEFTTTFAIDGSLPVFIGAFSSNIIGFIAAFFLIRNTAK